jgi:hypothetical protein
MPFYDYECEHGNREERWFAMGDAPPHVLDCHPWPPTPRQRNRVGYWLGTCQYHRVFGDFNFVEDRTRMYRNPRTGTRFSDTLGCEMPEDRVSRDALYASKGIEPVSPRDMPSQWKVAKEYADHLKSGGEKLDRKGEAALIEPPDLSGVKSVAQQLRESNYRASV